MEWCPAYPSGDVSKEAGFCARVGPGTDPQQCLNRVVICGDSPASALSGLLGLAYDSVSPAASELDALRALLEGCDDLHEPVSYPLPARPGASAPAPFEGRPTSAPADRTLELDRIERMITVADRPVRGSTHGVRASGFASQASGGRRRRTAQTSASCAAGPATVGLNAPALEMIMFHGAGHRGRQSMVTRGRPWQNRKSGVSASGVGCSRRASVIVQALTSRRSSSRPTTC